LTALVPAAHAATVEFAPEELPTESVVPVLDSNMAVKKKLIPFTHRLELGLTYGSVIDEMFFNNTMLGIEAFFHMSEDYALGFKYYSRDSGLSSYSEQFEQGTGSGNKLDFSAAPQPKSIMALTYRWDLLYGKVSFGKNAILPTTFNMDIDLGMNEYGGQALPYSSIGIGQKLYAWKHWGISLNYRFMFYQILDPVSTSIVASNPAPSESDFEKKLQISQGIDLGLSYLF
jgi:outer membrane beta-barrel protein